MRDETPIHFEELILCACTGPMRGERYCPCRLRIRAKLTLISLIKWRGAMVMEATAKRHVQHKCSDENCVVCNGGLSLCKVCGGAESSMPTECPGAKMTPEQAAAVQAGTIDFQGGQWCALAKLEVVKPEEK